MSFVHLSELLFKLSTPKRKQDVLEDDHYLLHAYRQLPKQNSLRKIPVFMVGFEWINHFEDWLQIQPMSHFSSDPLLLERGKEACKITRNSLFLTTRNHFLPSLTPLTTLFCSLFLSKSPCHLWGEAWWHPNLCPTLPLNSIATLLLIAVTSTFIWINLFFTGC